eukprot:gene5663-5725_t
MRTTTIGLLAGMTLLAGCGDNKQVDVKNATASEVAGKVGAAGLHFLPGAWETTVNMTDLSVAGMAPEMAAAMKQAMSHDQAGKPRVTRTCLTPEKAAKPDSTFFGKGDGHCTYKSFTMGDGKISGTMTCDDPRQAASTMTMNGTYTSDSYTMDMVMAGGQQGQAMSMHIAVTSHRVGDCKPDDKAP